MVPPFRFRDTWQCVSVIGRGSFASVWNASDVHSGAGTAIKWELIHPTDPPTISYESAVYAQVQGCRGVARIHCSGQEMNTNFLVMDRLGPNLEILRRFCRGSLSLKTVLMLGEQMLATIEQVHSRGIIVRDIKPANFAFGQIEDYKQLFLFDLGLCKLFLDPTTGTHMPFREGRAGIGTPRYASHNVHFGLEPSRRDDVEAIGLLLLYLLHGRLPWQGICAPDIPAKLLRIGEMKRGQPFLDLLQRSPTFFQAFFEHCRSLEFESKPDYSYLRQLLTDTMAKHKWEYDWEYDWWNPTEQGTLMPEEYKLDMSLVQPVRHEQGVL
ncbi:putative casein kinase [Abortiporus biennis]|nr:putative casein kinase [Abortiporus biennis]